MFLWRWGDSNRGPRDPQPSTLPLSYHSQLENVDKIFIKYYVEDLAVRNAFFGPLSLYSTYNEMEILRASILFTTQKWLTEKNIAAFQASTYI